MEVLVARIALYPDALIAVITGASLYPLHIVEAARFLDQHDKDKSLQPKESWDGSVVSLLNYPEVVRMMSDDLEWTQALGDAIAWQQKDLLVAIQQLRDEAVAKGEARRTHHARVDFDPAERACYYVRVIEIPTPRWTTYDVKIFGVELPEDVPSSIQERGYTSPIWYTPAG